MKFIAPLILLPFAISALALEKRCTDETSAILKDLSTLNTDTNAEYKSINSQSTTAPLSATEAIVLLNDATKVEKDLNATIKLCKAACTFTAAETTSIYNYLNSPLYTDTEKLLNSLIAHATAINSGGFQSATGSTLKTIGGLVSTLGKCLNKKGTGADMAPGKTLAKKYAAAFANAEAKV